MGFEDRQARDGDTHRPEVCDARCDCLAGEDLSGYGSCNQTAPGDFRIISNDAQDWGGGCGFAPVCVVLDPNPPVLGMCPADSSYGACSRSSDCPSGQVCVGQPVDNPVKLCSLTATPCVTDANCVGGDYCAVVNGSCLMGCSADSDCTAPIPLCAASSLTPCTPFGNECTQPGEHCDPLYLKCGRTCSSDPDCGFAGTADVTVLAGVDAGDPAAPATCNPPSTTTVPINSKDAGACVATIEAVTGPCAGP
jgi:hypothetical protein